MNDKITTDIISTTGINITKYDVLPTKVFINGVEVTDIESWNKAISTFSELQDKINNLQSKIDKANEIIKDWHQEYNGLMETNNIYIPKDKPSLFDLRNILKEDR